MMEDDADIRELATKAEFVKIGLRHTKDGIIFQFAFHPADLPEDLIRDPLGTRYLGAFVRLSEHDQPVAAKGTEEGRLAVKQAATLCADEKFQGWLCFNGYADEVSEEAAAIAVRTYCGIASRSELKTNKEAQAKFVGLRDMFVAKVTRSSGWKKSI